MHIYLREFYKGTHLARLLSVYGTLNRDYNALTVLASN